MTQQVPSSFWRIHLHIPLIIFVTIAAIIEFGGVDQWLADIIYRAEGGQWALKEAWITSVLIHKVGKYLSLAILLVVLISLLQTYFSTRLRHYRRELIFLLCAAAGSSGLVSAIKAVSHVSCAWDFSRYGGTQEYATVFTEMLHLSGGDCFPAGHATGGYAWMAFYFLGVHLRSSWRWAGLAFAIGIGLVFGISQQLRGAHFISHDVWTIGICWFFSLAMYRWLLANRTPYSSH